VRTPKACPEQSVDNRVGRCDLGPGGFPTKNRLHFGDCPELSASEKGFSRVATQFVWRSKKKDDGRRSTPKLSSCRDAQQRVHRHRYYFPQGRPRVIGSPWASGADMDMASRFFHQLPVGAVALGVRRRLAAFRRRCGFHGETHGEAKHPPKLIVGGGGTSLSVTYGVFGLQKRYRSGRHLRPGRTPIGKRASRILRGFLRVSSFHRCSTDSPHVYGDAVLAP